MSRIALVVLFVLVIGLACGMPEKGDYVAITQSAGMLEKYVGGQITEINESTGLIQLNPDIILYREGISNWRGSGNYTPDRMVLSVATILSLQVRPINETSTEFLEKTISSFPRPG